MARQALQHSQKSSNGGLMDAAIDFVITSLVNMKKEVLKGRVMDSV